MQEGDTIETYQEHGRWFYRLRLAPPFGHKPPPSQDERLRKTGRGQPDGYATQQAADEAGKAALVAWRTSQQE